MPGASRWLEPRAGIDTLAKAKPITVVVFRFRAILSSPRDNYRAQSNFHNVAMFPKIAFGPNLKLWFREDLGFVVVTKKRK